MSKFLILGRIEGDSESRAALDIATGLGAAPKNWLGQIKKEAIPWLNCAFDQREWDCLNIASVAHFIRFAAELEGILPESRLERTQWAHLPDWEETYWLPLDFPKIRVFKTPDGWPFAIASAQGLLRDLEAIRAASPGRLEVKPTLEGDDTSPLSPEDTLSWIWCALYEGASECVARNMPLHITA